MAQACRLMTKRVHPQQALSASRIVSHATQLRFRPTRPLQGRPFPLATVNGCRAWSSTFGLSAGQPFGNAGFVVNRSLQHSPYPRSPSTWSLDQRRLLHCSSTLRGTEPSRKDGQQNDQTKATKSSIAEDLNAADKKSTAKIVPNLLSKVTPPVLHENIYTLPNFLTTTRIITAPLISYALLHSQPVLAMGLFVYSSVTDLVDGYLARRYNTGTVLGSILDPFADKLLMTVTTVSLYSIGTFPWWLALIILGRDGGLALSALYFRWISLPPPRTMNRYWDFSLPSAEVRPTEISKVNTLLQFLLVANGVLLPVLPESFVEAWNLWGVFEGWMGLVAGTTIWSGMSYLFTKDAIRFIGQGDQHGNDSKSK